MAESSCVVSAWLILPARDCETEWNEVLELTEEIHLDARGLDCPMPLLKTKRALNAMEPGQLLRVQATDSGSVRDFKVFARQSGNLLLSSEELQGVYTFLLQKRLK